jgi:hypothetical protein
MAVIEGEESGPSRWTRYNAHVTVIATRYLVSLIMSSSTGAQNSAALPSRRSVNILVFFSKTRRGAVEAAKHS